MTPTLIVLGLLALGVAIVVFATRSKPGARASTRGEQDTGWNDPITPANQTEAHPFAHAPEPSADAERRT